jgi:hypothetical protein
MLLTFFLKSVMKQLDLLSGRKHILSRKNNRDDRKIIFRYS